MINKQIDIGNALLTTYIIGNSKDMDIKRRRPAILIFPGGGYEFISERESEPPALAFMAKGYNTFVLKYSVSPEARFPVQLNQAEAALAYIRENADELNTDPNAVVVMGFSAGGHLAGSLSLMGKIRPDAMVLCYPVITSGEFAHRDSFKALGKNISLEEYVSEDTPPAFLWHTYDDGCVPVENSFKMAEALKRKNVPFELHIFDGGGHGMSTCSIESEGSKDSPNINPHVGKWIELCAEWLNKVLKV